MRGFTFYHGGKDYFFHYESQTYRTKSVAEHILLAMGKEVSPANVEYIRKRIQRCTCEVHQNRNGNQVVRIYGVGFAIVDPEHKTVFLTN